MVTKDFLVTDFLVVAVERGHLGLVEEDLMLQVVVVLAVSGALVEDLVVEVAKEVLLLLKIYLLVTKMLLPLHFLPLRRSRNHLIFYWSSFTNQVCSLNLQNLINRIIGRMPGNLVSEIEKLAKQVKSFIKVGSVNVDKDQKLAKQYNIDVFPAVLLIAGTQTETMARTGTEFSELCFINLLFTQELTGKDISTFLTNKIPGQVTGVRHTSLDRFLYEDPKPKALLVTTKSQIPIIFKSLAFKFSSKMNFGLASKSDEIIVEQLGIKQFPTKLLYASPTSEPKIYKGTFTICYRIFLNIIHQEIFLGKVWMTFSRNFYKKARKKVPLELTLNLTKFLQVICVLMMVYVLFYY